MMKRYITINTILLLCTISLYSADRMFAQSVHGRVYLDLNENGQFDQGDRPLEGIGVTDGMTIVDSDAKGQYQITITPDPVLCDGGEPIVSICIPDNTKPLKNWFSIVKGETMEVNFPLVASNQSMPFQFIHATDPHCPRGGKKKAENFIADMVELKSSTIKPSFCVITGDLTHLSDDATHDEANRYFEAYQKMQNEIPLPTFAIPGNHDIAGGRQNKPVWNEANPDYAYGFYTRIVGPLRWSFDYAGVHFVGIDFNYKENDAWKWGTPDTAIDWLDKDLSRVRDDRLIVLFFHAPSNPTKLSPVLAKHGVKTVFYGHAHTVNEVEYQGVNAYCSGSLSEIFNDKDRQVGYRIVEIDKEGVDTFYRYTSDEHTIIVNYPRYNSMLKAGDELKGQFFDPKETITSLAISSGGKSIDVPFTRQSVACAFTAPLPAEWLNGKPAEKVNLTFTVSDGTNDFSFKYDYSQEAASQITN